MALKYNESRLGVQVIPHTDTNSVGLVIELRPDIDSVDETLRVETNDTVVPIKSIQVRARKARPFQLSDTIITFPDVPQGERVSREVSALSGESDLIKSLRILQSTGDTGFTAALNSFEGNTPRAVLTVTFTAPTDIGSHHYFAASFVAECILTDESRHEATIEVYANVDADGVEFHKAEPVAE